MRPKKTRWIECYPGARCFVPKGSGGKSQEKICLSLDEFEAMRLACLEEMKQEDAAKSMKVSRPTFSRILTSAQRKIAVALVQIKTLTIEGGCCKFKEEGDNAG